MLLLSAVKIWICSCHRKKVEVLCPHPQMFPQSPKLSLRNAPSPLWEKKVALEPYSKRRRQIMENPGVCGREGRKIEDLMPVHQIPQIFEWTTIRAYFIHLDCSHHFCKHFKICIVPCLWSALWMFFFFKLRKQFEKLL